MGDLFERKVGHDAEADFRAFLLHLGAKEVRCPWGEDPGCSVAFERASRYEDYNGVDFWIWFDSCACWIPMDLTVINGNTNPECLAEKRRRGRRRGVVVVKLRKASLELAAEGSIKHMNYVYDDLKAEFQAQLAAIRKRLLTRQKLARKAV